VTEPWRIEAWEPLVDDAPLPLRRDAANPQQACFDVAAVALAHARHSADRRRPSRRQR
jgi:hypothetical protein